MFSENALFAAQQGVVAVISDALLKYPDDEDLLFLSAKVLVGIADALSQYSTGDSKQVQAFQSEGAITSMTFIVKKLNTDANLLPLCLEFFKYLTILELEIDSKALLTSLMQNITPSSNPSTTLQLIKLLNYIVQSGGAAEAGKMGISKSLLQYCQNFSKMEKENIECTEQSLAFVQQISNSGYVNAGELENVIMLMEKFKTKKNIQQKGRVVIEVILNPEQVEKCLKTLKNENASTEERRESMFILNSMAYSPTYIDLVVQAKGISILCDIVKSSSSDIISGNKDETRVRGLAGACKILAMIAENVENHKELENSGGVVAVVSALEAIHDNPEITSGCLVFLAAIGRTSPHTLETSNSLDKITKVMSKNQANIDICMNGTLAIQSIISSRDASKILYNAGLYDLLITCLNRDDITFEFQSSLIFCIRYLIIYKAEVDNTELQVLKRIGVITKINITEKVLCKETADISFAIASIPNSNAILTQSEISLVLFGILLTNVNVPLIHEPAVAALDIFASEADVSKIISVLEAAVKGNQSTADIDGGIAAIGGLALVSRLKPVLKKEKVASILLKYIENWINDVKCKDAAIFIKTATSALSVIIQDADEALKEVPNMLTLTQNKRIRQIIDKQPIVDNTLQNLILGTLVLCPLLKQQDDTSKVIESYLNVMQTYSESRITHVNCIHCLGIIGFNPNSAEIFIKNGALKYILQYMTRYPLYEDVQAIGFFFLAQIVSHDDQISLEYLRKNGCPEICRAAMKHHRSSKICNKYLWPVTMAVMSSEALEMEISEALKSVQNGVANEKNSLIEQGMSTLATILNTPVAVKISVKLNIGIRISEAVDYLKNSKQKGVEMVILDTGNVYDNVTAKRVGLVHMQKTNNITPLVELLSCIDAQDTTKEKTTSQYAALDAIIRFIKYDALNVQTISDLNIEEELLSIVESNRTDVGLLTRVCVILSILDSQGLLAATDFDTLVELLLKNAETSDKADMSIECLEALNAMIESKSDNIFTAIDNTNGLSRLIALVGVDNSEESIQALHCVASLQQSIDLRKHYKEKPQEFAYTIETLLIALDRYKQDSETSKMIMTMIYNLCVKKDKVILERAGAVSILGSVVKSHVGNDEVFHAAAAILSLLDAEAAIEGYFDQIMKIDANQPGGMQQIAVVCDQLAVFLAAEIPPDSKALKDVEKVMEKLESIGRRSKDNANLASVSAVMRSMVVTFLRDKSNDDQASKVTQPIKMYGELITSDDPNDRAIYGRNFVNDTFVSLNAGLCHPALRGSVIELSTNQKFMNAVDCSLVKHQNDSATVANILGFLQNLSEDNEAATSLGLLSKNATRLGARPENTIIILLNTHRKNPSVQLNGFGVLAGMVRSSEAIPEGLDRKTLISLKELSDTSPEALAGYINLLGAMHKVNPDEYTRAEINRSIAKVNNLEASKSLTGPQEVALALALGNMLNDVIEVDRDLAQPDVIDTMVGLMSNHNHDPEAVILISNSLRRLMERDESIAPNVSKAYATFIFGKGLDLVKSDPNVAKAALACLSAAGGNSRNISSIGGWDGALTEIEASAASMGIEGKEVAALASALHKKVEGVSTKMFSLVDIENEWNGLLDQEEVIIFDSNDRYSQQTAVVFDYTEEYGTTQSHTSEFSDLSIQLKAGCGCLKILNLERDNDLHCIENNEVSLLLNIMQTQLVEGIAQYAVSAAVVASSVPEISTAFYKHPGVEHRVIAVVIRGWEYDGDDMNTVLAERLQFMHQIVKKKTLFDSTKAMNNLDDIWIDWEQGRYEDEVLIQMFKCMRVIMNDGWVDTVVELNIPDRLVKLCENIDECPIKAIPDIEYLLGVYGSNGYLSDLVGDLGGIEALLLRVRDSMQYTGDPDHNNSITNGCFALSNLVFLHNKNGSRFKNDGGMGTNIEVLQAGVDVIEDLEYNIATAASVLMTNMSFKRDEIKKLYGEMDAPSIIIQIIASYNGDNDANAHRCLTAMFKAIANLALIADNVDIFLSNGIEQSMSNFFQRSEGIPDAVIDVAMRTMANLVLEYTDEYMEQFSVVLQPMVHMLSTSEGRSVTTITLVLEVIGSLCRLPSNANMFVEADGIPTVLTILGNHTNITLYTQGLSVIAAQANNVEAQEIMLDSGVFNFLGAAMDSHLNNPDAKVYEEFAINTIKCTRRLIIDQNMSEKFVESDGIKFLCRLITTFSDQRNMIQEALRLFILNLTLHPNPEYAESELIDDDIDDDFEGDLPDEGILPMAERIDRPPSPRSWESLGLDFDEIAALISALSTYLISDEYRLLLKVQRLGVGILGYFACEKISKLSDIYIAAEVPHLIATLLKDFGLFDDIMKMCYHLIVNLAYTCDLANYAVLRSEPMLIDNLKAALLKDKTNVLGEKYQTLMNMFLDNDITSEDFSEFVTWNFPLKLTGYDDEKYPNGVQSLDKDLKAYLRKGSKAMYLINNDWKPMTWTASPDLSYIQISLNESAYFSVQMSRMRLIAKGNFTSALITKKTNAKLTMTLLGPILDAYPDGFELNLKFENNKEREYVYDVYTEWKEASMSAF